MDDVDLFSQALMQLTEVNKAHEEYLKHQPEPQNEPEQPIKEEPEIKDEPQKTSAPVEPPPINTSKPVVRHTTLIDPPPLRTNPEQFIENGSHKPEIKNETGSINVKPKQGSAEAGPGGGHEGGILQQAMSELFSPNDFNVDAPVAAAPGPNLVPNTLVQQNQGIKRVQSAPNFQQQYTNSLLNSGMRGQLNQPIRGQFNQPVRGQHNQLITGQLNQQIRGQLNQPIRGQLNQPIRGQLKQPQILTVVPGPDGKGRVIKRENYNPAMGRPANSSITQGGIRLLGPQGQHLNKVIVNHSPTNSRSNSPVPQVYSMNNNSNIRLAHATSHGSGVKVLQMNPQSALGVNNGVKTQLTNKDVSRIWANEEVSIKEIANGPSAIEEEVADEEEELGHAETYNDYMPTKLKLGRKHPDPVVETSSLASVEPVDINYQIHIPEETIDNGKLSALQLESIVYASQRHCHFLPNGERCGFLIGDGAGVGKGRTIAGIIFENYLQGRRRSLWLSVSNDLKIDAERDLKDIGAGKIDVYSLNKFKYMKISSKENNSVKKGVIFSTYSSLIGESSSSSSKYRTRFKQLVHWLGHEFDGTIIFDECHRAKNLCPTGSSKPTKTGLTVLELQKKLPKARVIYASATGASEPRNMAYMTRLGLWGKDTPFPEFNDFIMAVERRGVGAMELVAMEMKLRGLYIARQLSFHGVTFRIEEVPIEKSYAKIYNEAVSLWVDAREKFQMAADLIDAEHRMRKTMWGQFWSSHQRFFKYLCISAKVNYCVKLAREAVKNGKCVVIGLQSTGEARTLEQLEECGGELTDFVSTAKGVFQSLIEKHFPAPDRRKTLNDLFGTGGYSSMLQEVLDETEPGRKRKAQAKEMSAKRAKMRGASSDSGSDSSDSDNQSSSEKEETEESEKSSASESEDDDFNPFGNGSDSDEDPWLKRQKVKVKKEKKKKLKEKKPKKQKKKRHKEKKAPDTDDEYETAMLAAAKPSRDSSSTNLPSSGTSSQFAPGMDAVDKAVAMKKHLLNRMESLGDKLPPNTLDELIDQLGGTENVAEMTGRKGRVVSDEAGEVMYESRSESDVPLEVLNLKEKQRFMDGEKNIAIISEAASSGISLQSDRRAQNQRRRVHITLELPWSADRAIQQFGRTHRSNQVNAPEYVFLISDLAGERRFASTVAKRLESLGALTHGDRRATESRDLSQFNIDNKYGKSALEVVMKSVLDIEAPLVAPPAAYSGKFMKDCKNALAGVGILVHSPQYDFYSFDKDYNNISKFLNRILGTPVELQNAIFKYFTDTLNAVILQAKANGRWDLGILDLGSGSESVKVLQTRTFVGTYLATSAKTEIHTLSVERGLSWNAASDIWRDHTGKEDGFYVSIQTRFGSKKTAILAVALQGGRKKEKLYSVYRPSTGLQLRTESLSEIKKKYRKVYIDEAQPYWNDQYQASATTCNHAYWKGNCKRRQAGLQCEVGLRSRTYHVLSGSVLSIWSKVESVLAANPGGNVSRMQVIRLRTEDGKRIVGTIIPTPALQPLCNVLSQESKRTYKSEFADPVSTILPTQSRPMNNAAVPLSMPDIIEEPVVQHQNKLQENYYAKFFL
ncbi:unnamed protein product [Owenia fusiformis]|uniref:Uncharacterized protein n=1 Tax=Owenia fusiformis TaxID=6347 RepID=A0A8J1TK36_OWEFU|nr:unnamed protein product [Owenia fusiformis]